MRYLKLIAFAVMVIAAAGAAIIGLKVRAGLRGPDAPVCAGTPLGRKTFGAPLQLTTAATPGDFQTEVTAAVLPSGALAVAFLGPKGLVASNTLGVAVVPLEGPVQVRSLSSPRRQHFDPWLAVEPSGRLHLVWLGHDGGSPEERMQVGYAQSTDGLTWTAPIAIHDTAQDCPEDAAGCIDKPMVAVGADPAQPGQSAVTAFYFSAATGGLRAVRAKAGGAFGASSPVGVGAYGDVDVGLSGRLHLAWVGAEESREEPNRYGDKRFFVEYASSEDGKAFSAPVRVSAADEPVPFFFSNPQVVADEERSLVYVLYPTGGPDLNWRLMLATSSDGGRTFRRVQVNDDGPCAVHMTPSAALDPHTGTLHVTWLENRAGQGRLAYAACQSGGARCGTNEAVSDPFASFRLARHLPEWLGDYGALVYDRPRRTLHAVWAQPVLESGTPVARVFHAKAVLPAP